MNVPQRQGPGSHPCHMGGNWYPGILVSLTNKSGVQWLASGRLSQLSRQQHAALGIICRIFSPALCFKGTGQTKDMCKETLQSLAQCLAG